MNRARIECQCPRCRQEWQRLTQGYPPAPIWQRFAGSNPRTPERRRKLSPVQRTVARTANKAREFLAGKSAGERLAQLVLWMEYLGWLAGELEVMMRDAKQEIEAVPEGEDDGKTK